MARTHSSTRRPSPLSPYTKQPRWPRHPTPAHLRRPGAERASLHHRRQFQDHSLRGFRNTDMHVDTNDQHGSDASSPDDASSEGEANSFFCWEEESTLFSDLMDDGTSDPSDAQLAVLVDSLQAPFAQQGTQLKKEIAKAFVPTVNRVKTQYATIHDTIDVPYGRGLLQFNKACKDMELSTLHAEAEIRDAHIAAQRVIEKLFNELEQEYAHRDRLWVDFERAVNDLVDPVLETLNDTPAKIERTIASLEKHSKALESNAGDTGVTEKKLKDLLSKLAS